MGEMDVLALDALGVEACDQLVGALGIELARSLAQAAE